MNVFNVAEIIDMGIAKERRRRDFYALAAKKFNGKAFKALFTRLRDWEESHIKKFTQIRNSVRQREITESSQGEFEAYIKAMVDEMLYKQVSAKEFAKNVKSPIAA